MESEDLNWEPAHSGQYGNDFVSVERKVGEVAEGAPRFRGTVAPFPIVDGNDTLFGIPEDFEAATREELYRKLRDAGLSDENAREVVRHANNPGV